MKALNSISTQKNSIRVGLILINGIARIGMLTISRQYIFFPVGRTAEWIELPRAKAKGHLLYGTILSGTTYQHLIEMWKNLLG